MTFRLSRHFMLLLKIEENKNIVIKPTSFPIIVEFRFRSKSSVFDADRELLNLGSTDNAGKSGKPNFRGYPFTLGLGFFCVHQRPMTWILFVHS